MSALIKNAVTGADQNGIRSFASGPYQQEPVRPPRAPLSEAERRDLEREVEDLREALARNNQDHAAELEETSRKARETALREANEKEIERIATLRNEMTQAVEHWENTLEDLELLALALAHTALDRLLSDPANKHALIKSSIARQIEGLRRESILNICLSPADYSDDALRRLASDFGGGLVFRLDPELASAACRIQLRLGQIELSLPQHRSALNKLWVALAGGDA